jgi:RNA polymerase sigma factor (sigma-70 family)
MIRDSKKTDLKSNVEIDLKEVFALARKMAKRYGRIGIVEEEDLVQTVVSKMLQHKMNANWRGWLSKVMRSTASDVRRRQGRESAFRYEFKSAEELVVLERTVDEKTVPRRDMVEIDLMPHLKKMLVELRQPLRTVLVLYSEGYSYDEIASLMKISVGTVRSRLFNARKRARKLLFDVA